MTAVPYRELDAVFLDAGNTLVSMDHALLRDVLANEGVEATPHAIARAEAAARPALSRWIGEGSSSDDGSTFVVYVGHMLRGLDVASESSALARRLVARVRATVPTQRLWSRVLPGVPEALRALRAAGLRLVVVSNSDGTAETAIAAAGLRPLVDAVVDSAIVGSEKPDRGIFEHALGVAGTRPERSLHVGDLHAVDVVGARTAGLHAVLLDPFGDWDGVDCERAPDLADLARRIAAARA